MFDRSTADVVKASIASFSLHVVRRRKFVGSFLLLAIISSVCVPALGADDDKDIRIGVLANRGAEKCMATWEPTARYLSKQIPGHTFKIVPLAYGEIESTVKDAEVEFILGCPNQGIGMVDLYGISPIATLENRHSRGTASIFGGVIFCRADHKDIKSISDLDGKKFMAVGENAFGGWQMAWREIKAKDIDPHSDFDELLFGGTHDAVVYAVRDGEVDAGTVRTNTLERMEAEGKINISDFRALDERDIGASLPLLCSTRTYPEWPFAKTKHTSSELAGKVAVALLKMPPDSAAAQAGKYAGWTIPMNYQPVHECLKELRVGPYKDYGKITAGEVIRKYWYWLAITAVTLVVMTVTAISSVKLSRRLKQAQWELRSELGERRRIEDSIRKSERRFRDIAESMSDWIWETDTNCVYSYCSRSVQDILGYNRKDVTGKTPFDFMVPADAERLRGQLGEIMRQQCSFRNIENWNITSDGRRVCLLTNGSPIFDDDGELIGYRGIDTDITRRKKAESELRNAKETAEKATDEMAETNRQLETAIGHANEMAIAAEMADQTKSEFLANMSHEIRTPLTAILGYTELMMDKSQEEDERVKCLDIVQRNGEHLLMLINDILDISKIEAGKLNIESRQYSVPPVVSEIISMMRVRAIDKGISLTAEYTGQIPEQITSDEARLRQSLINLIGNAVKFTDTGGVKVVVSFLPEWREDTPAVEIQVVDTGIGVSPENLDKLFEAFTQADASTSRKYGGTGLGLAITQRIAELMGGELKAESVFGEGSTFTITIPTGDIEGVKMLERPAEAVIRQSAEVQLSSNVLTGKRILLAEDGEDNMRLIKAILKKAGAEVIGVENGLLAVEQTQSQKFDVILMDMQMPEMDGYEATTYLRNNDYTGPIIALTAHAMASDRERCVNAGCDDHLTKPIEKARFIPTIARYAGVEELSQTKTESQTETTPPEATPVKTTPKTDEVIISELIDDPDLGEIVGDFVEGLPGRLEEMRQSSANNDHERLQRLAHQLKGAGGSYGYPMLTDEAKTLEQAAKDSDIESENLSLNKLMVLIASIVRGLETAKVA